MTISMCPLGELMASKSGTVDPAKHPDEVFDLYSIPAHEQGEPEVLAGAAIGYRGMVKGILEALRKELPEPKIVATGGDATWIISGMEERIIVDTDLTLHGLRLVYSSILLRATCW